MALHKIDPHEYPGLETLAAQVSNRIAAALPPDVGFALFTFHWGKDGGISYTSNAKREDMVAAIREWLDAQETGA
jgi:hypothetical protein